MEAIGERSICLRSVKAIPKLLFVGNICRSLKSLCQGLGYLIDLDMYFIIKIAEFLGIEASRIIKSSTMAITGDRIGRLIAICKSLKADTFYEGASGRNYIDEERFLAEGIQVVFQNYRHPVYPQLYGEFIPYLSIIDLLFNHGENSLNIVTNQL